MVGSWAAAPGCCRPDAATRGVVGAGRVRCDHVRGRCDGNPGDPADVATLAGVSLATASRALSPTKGQSVGSELRARVRAAAAELSYSPNAHAQAMRSPTTTVGLMVHDIADPVAAAIASGVLAAAAERGLIVTIGASGSDPEAEIRLVEALRRQRARGGHPGRITLRRPPRTPLAGRGGARRSRPVAAGW